METKRLGPYELLEPIGRGGAGTVYKARHVEVRSRFVALKILHRATERAAERFRREARTLASISHPNIVRIHDFGEVGSNLYLAMELVEGIDLHEIVEQGPIVPEEAARIMAAVCRGMHHVHDYGIVHRDLKPMNILLGSDGRPRITDFGISRELDSETRLTGTGAILGTPWYMAPEQARGDRDAIDGRSDVFSLGVILYELLTGSLPFPSETLEKVLDEIQNRKPPRPSEIRRAVPRELERICLRAMEKRRRDRYQTAAEMADELDRFLTGEGEPVASALPGPEAFRRAGTALLLLALGSGLFLWLSSGESEPSSAATSRETPRQPAEASAEPRPDPFALARKQIAAEDWPGAIEVLDGVLADDPRNGAALRMRGLARLHAGDRLTAMIDFSEAIELNPSDARAYYLRAQAKHNQGDKAGAYRDLNKAIAFDPDYAEAFNLRGKIRRKAGDPEGAQEDANRAIDLKPNLLNAYYQRARARVQLDDRKGALADLDRVLEKKPESLFSRRIRSRLRLETGDYEGAEADIARWLAAEPERVEPRLLRARARLYRRRFEAALADYDQVLEREPRNIEALFGRGVVRAILDRRAEALTDLTEAAGRAPNDARPALWVAGLGGGVERLRALERPGPWERHLVRFYLGEATVKEALQAAQKTKALETRSRRLADLQGYAAWRAERVGDLAEARRRYRACLAEDQKAHPITLWAKIRLKALKSR